MSCEAAIPNNEQNHNDKCHSQMYREANYPALYDQEFKRTKEYDKITREFASPIYVGDAKNRQSTVRFIAPPVMNEHKFSTVINAKRYKYASRR